MSIETELKAFNGLFEQFIKAEQEKTNAISKLADAVISAYSDNEKLRMHSAPAAVLNEAKVAKVSSKPSPAPTQDPAQELATEKTEETKDSEEVVVPSEEEINFVRKKASALCSSYAQMAGRPAIEKFVSSFGWGPKVRAFTHAQRVAFIQKLEPIVASLEASHA